MLTSTFDDEKKVPIAQQVVGSENVDYHHHQHQQGVDSLQDEEEDKAAEKRVLRKIDLIVLPMVRTSLDQRACARNHKIHSPADQIPFKFSINQSRCVSSSSHNTSTNNPSPTPPSTVSSPISISIRINSAGSRAASISPNSLPKAPLFIS